MSWIYVYGAKRWKRWNGYGDVRGHRPAKGWEAEAYLLDNHPITGKRFRYGRSEWWIREVFRGGQR